MLTISSLSKAFGEKTLFDEVNLQINEGDRIAIVGPNGAGKTTLFSILLGSMEPDHGQVNIQRNRTLGYLPQESAEVPDDSVLELAVNIHPEIPALRKLLSEQHEDDPVSVSHDDGSAYARYEELGGHTLEVRAKKVLMGLGFKE